LFKRLRSTDGVHVYEGDVRKRRHKGGLEQKMVDVMLAVDMLTHSFRRNMQRATLLTGDQDFKPLVDALVQQGMYVTLWYPRGETNSELMDAADRRKPIMLKELASLLTPESRKRFPLPSDELISGTDFRGAHHQWNDENGNPCSIIDDGGSNWVINRANRDFIRSPNWGLLRMRALEKGIALPAGFENYGIDHPLSKAGQPE
jgi:NYN domain